MSKTVLIFCLALLGAGGPLRAQEWTIEEIGQGTKPELAVDGQGRPHIAYMTEDHPGGVFHALKDGGNWQIDQVSEGYFYGPLDLAIGPEDGPHIAYHDHDTENLAYAFKQGDDWAVEWVNHPGHDGWDSSIALGAEGEVFTVGIEPTQFGSASGAEWAVRAGGTGWWRRSAAAPFPTNLAPTWSWMTTTCPTWSITMAMTASIKTVISSMRCALRGAG